jgi:hypothetical protein
VAVAHQGACADAGTSGSACQTTTDCIQYPDGTGGCCGACLAKTDPRPAMVQCLLPCQAPPTNCVCLQNRCTSQAR